MDFEYTPRTKELMERLQAFMDEFIYPNEGCYYDEVAAGNYWPKVIEELKPKAGPRACGTCSSPIRSAGPG